MRYDQQKISFFFSEIVPLPICGKFVPWAYLFCRPLRALCLPIMKQGAHAGLMKSYICFSICKALQSLIFVYFRPNRSYKILMFIQKKKISTDNLSFLLEINSRLGHWHVVSMNAA